MIKNIEQYRGLMVRVLQQSSGKGLKAEAVVDAILQRITDVEMVVGSMGGDTVPVLSVPVPEKNDFSRLVADTDASQRIGAPAKEEDGLVEHWNPEDLSSFAKDQMPSEIQVQPPGFAEPFTIKKFIEVAPGGLGFVRIIYQQPQAPITTTEGQRVGPTVQIGTTDKILDGDSLTADIIRQAQNMYSKTPRVLTPKAPPMANRPGDLSNALSAEAPGTGEEGMSFNEMRAKSGNVDLSSVWKAQSR